MAKRIVLVAHPGAMGIEVLGVRDLLEMANWCARDGGQVEPFAIELATHDGRAITLWSGHQLGPTINLTGLPGDVDSLIVIGGPVAEEAAQIPELVDGVRQASARSRRVVGICTGVFILAAAGLLDGRRCTTHWMYGPALSERYPNIQVDTRPVFVADGPVWTSGGLSTGFDLALALIEADAGLSTARAVAQRSALYLRRTGNQAQYDHGQLTSGAIRQPLKDLLKAIAENPQGNYSVAALSSRALMSERNFLRVFQAEVGTSPRRYVEQVRLRAARTLLETEDRTVEAVASIAGFANYQSMRRVFLSELGVTPSQYRDRFGGTQRPDDQQAGGEVRELWREQRAFPARDKPAGSLRHVGG
jgi:transcriptional regulator GlxA family with amidase domain